MKYTKEVVLKSIDEYGAFDHIIDEYNKYTIQRCSILDTSQKMYVLMRACMNPIDNNIIEYHALTVSCYIYRIVNDLNNNVN